MNRFRRAIFALLIAAILLWWLLPSSVPTLSSDSILVVDLQGAFVESNEAPLLLRLTSQAPRPFVSILSELRKAQRDVRIVAVLLRIRDLEIGWAKAQELRDAITELGAAGK